jgi:GNAT superfamily N-acetyltransferase
MAIDYRLNTDVTVDQVIELLIASTLAERRPVDNRPRMQAMLQCSNLVITAWEKDQLVGIARSVSDYSYCTYLSDLAVRKSHQKCGIGTRLIQSTQAAAPMATVVLLSAPAAVEYYPHIGMERHNSAWILRPGSSLR